MYRFYNPNPAGKKVGDCTVRAITKATGQSWEEVFMCLCVSGLSLCDMPSSNAVWGNVLAGQGFVRRSVPEHCPVCYTVADFAEEFPQGTYIVALDGHVVCVKDGVIYDSWDSSDKTPLYYWERTVDNDV